MLEKREGRLVLAATWCGTIRTKMYNEDFQEVWYVLLQVLPSTKEDLLRTESMFPSYGAQVAYHLNLSLC